MFPSRVPIIRCTHLLRYPSLSVPIITCTQIWMYPSHGLPIFRCTHYYMYPNLDVPISWVTHLALLTASVRFIKTCTRTHHAASSKRFSHGSGHPILYCLRSEYRHTCSIHNTRTLFTHVHWTEIRTCTAHRQNINTNTLHNSACHFKACVRRHHADSSVPFFHCSGHPTSRCSPAQHLHPYAAQPFE